MTRIVLALLAALAVAVGTSTPADACGVKLTVKSPKVQKRVQETAQPSHILVLGSPPSKRLTSWLKQAGHTVESTKQASAAKRKDYAIVIADPEKVDEARTNFPNSRVVTRSGTLSSNVKKIERALASGPSSGDGARVASRESTARVRPTSASLRTPPRQREPEQAVETKPTETRVASVETPPVRTEPAKEPVKEPVEDEDEGEDNTPTPGREAAPVKPVKSARWAKELFFGSNSTSLSEGMRSKLKENARWMEQNPDVSITIEGHTDAAGPAEYNKVLGERRADAVKAFLVELGVDSSRIEVISYGEERPAYSSSRKNRRVLLVKNN